MNTSEVFTSSLGEVSVGSDTKRAVFFLAAFVQPPIMAMGCVSSLTNVFVFLRLGLKDSILLCFFILSCVDLAGLVLMIPSSFFIVFPESVPGSWRVRGDTLGLMLVYYYTLFYDVSQVITTFTAVQKCCCVALPLRFKNTFTRFRTFVVVCLLTSACTVMYLPMLATQSLMETYDSIRNKTVLTFWISPIRFQVTAARGVCSVVLTTACQLTTVICLIVLASSLRKSSAFRSSAMLPSRQPVIGIADQLFSSSKFQIESAIPSVTNIALQPEREKRKHVISRKELQVVKSTTFISILFVLCNTPKLLIHYAVLIEPEFNMFRRYENIFALANDSRFCAEALNAALSMFVYVKCNRKYRDCTLKGSKVFRRYPSHKEMENKAESFQMQEPNRSFTESELKKDDKIQSLLQHLLIASKNGDTGNVRFLVHSGANVNERNDSGRTALMLAAKNGHCETVRYLIKNGANINNRGNNGSSALLYASENGHAEVVKILLMNGANIHDKNYLGITPLMIASLYGHPDVVQILIQCGGSVNEYSKYGWTAKKNYCILATFLSICLSPRI
ncbi:hypothetical protein Btru_030016 [Bulinus truncatus]|nr:hypothetical protein Btru_030016 [Bulinus truncatus]